MKLPSFCRVNFTYICYILGKFIFYIQNPAFKSMNYMSNQN